MNLYSENQENQKETKNSVKEQGMVAQWLKKKKNPPANAEDEGSIPGSRRSPGEGNGNSLQYSRLENPMDRRAWEATVQRVAKSQIRLSD